MRRLLALTLAWLLLAGPASADSVYPKVTPVAYLPVWVSPEIPATGD